MFSLLVGDQRYEIHDEITFIGRDPTCGIIISDDSEVSRRHCCLVDLGSRVIAMDFKSSNGTLVNSVPIQQQELRPGDQVQVGGTVFTVDVPEPQRALRHITSVGYKQHFIAEDYPLALKRTCEFLNSEMGRGTRDLFLPLLAKLKSIDDTNQIAEMVLDAGMTAAGADRGFVMLLGDERQPGMDMIARSGLDPDYFLRRDLHYVLINEAIENQRVVIPKSNYVEQVFQQNTLVIPNVCSSVVVPLIALSHPMGAIYADRRIASGPFTDNDIKALIFASYQASVFIGFLRLATPFQRQDEILQILDTSLSGGDFIYCEVCGTPIDPMGEHPVVSCGKCETLHHKDCWEYNNRCAIYGCMHTRMRALPAA